MRLPSIKSLKEIAGDRAKELRSILEISKRSDLEAVLDRYPVTRDWYNKCYHPMPLHVAKLSIASEITECHGVEYAEGIGRSRSFDYVNTGDSYAPTLIRFVDATYRVAAWGNIVERGRYA